MRALLPIKPVVVVLRLSIAPDPGAATRLPSVMSRELTPVPPAVVVSVEIPAANVTAPNFSLEAVCARPRSAMVAPRSVMGALSLMRLPKSLNWVLSSVRVA